jgi:DNA-binding CsgD family transcriptional regulator
MDNLAKAPENLVPLFEALQLSPDAVFVTDRHSRIVFWNRAAERILGYTPEEMVGTPCSKATQGCDVFGNRYCSDSCPVTQMAARGETARHFDLDLRARDGRTVRVDVSILTFVGRPADGAYLAHVLTPSHRQEAAPRPVEPEAAPPRPAMVAVHESPDARARRLTAREVEVLGMLAAGHPTAEIAARLHISALTARNHTQNILDKLEVHSKAEAVAFAFQKRLF